jgi:hypothetical protein
MPELKLETQCNPRIFADNYYSRTTKKHPLEEVLGSGKLVRLVYGFSSV